MSHNTANPAVTDNTDIQAETPETVETVSFDLNSTESVETWLKGISWTTEAYRTNADGTPERDEDGDPVFSPTPDMTVIQAYNGANQSQKARIRATMTNVVQGYIRRMKVIPAANAQSTLDGLFTPKAAKEAIDPLVAIAARVANLREAANRLESGLSVPKGIKTDIWDDRDLSELWAIVDNTDFDPIVADSIASAAIARRSDKHDIQGVVDRAFEGVESGTFLTIAQIARRGALPDYQPGSGAIGAALTKTSGTPITGVTFQNMTPTTPRGAIKD